MNETFEPPAGGPISAAQYQAELEDTLSDYVDSRSIKLSLERHLEDLGKPLRVWLESHEGETLFDGEHEIRAFLQPRRGAKPYELRRIYEQDRSLFEQLLYNGCLRADAESIKRAGALVAGVSGYAGPEPVSYALQVKGRES